MLPMPKPLNTPPLIPGTRLNIRMREQLELEVVSTSARLQLTRLLRKSVKVTNANSEDAHQIELIRQNKIVNIVNNSVGRPIYTLELSDWDYLPAEYAWHNGEIEVAMRRPDTATLAEILADLIEETNIRATDVNQILNADGCGFRIYLEDNDALIKILDVTELPDQPVGSAKYTNVRKLVERMDRAMQDKDWSLVLHTGASIFETLAKQVVPNPNVQNQSLGGWFSQYRNHSKLATPLLDVMEEIFKRRNIEPLAGHGSASDPSITQQEAIQIRELAVVLVRLERALTETTIGTHS